MSSTFWQFLALFFSGWIYIDATYRQRHWQRGLFKSLTLLLLLILAWSAPQLGVYGYLIALGLVASMLADGLSWLPEERFLSVIGALFISHLLYAIAFAMQLSWVIFWPLPIVLLLVGVATIAVILPRLNNLRWPIVTYLSMTLLMVWIAGERYLEQGSELSFSLFIGAILLLIANVIWLVSRYRYPFKLSIALHATAYFIGHFLIIRSLYF